MDLTTLADVKLQGNVPDASDDAWIAAAIASVSSILETEANRWLAPRGTLTRTFDGTLVRSLGDMAGSTPRYFGPAWMPQWGRVLPVYDGVTAVAYLGVADADQPDDGTGTYTQITKGIHLRGAIRRRIATPFPFALARTMSGAPSPPFRARQARTTARVAISLTRGKITAGPQEPVTLTTL